MTARFAYSSSLASVAVWAVCALGQAPPAKSAKPEAKTTESAERMVRTTHSITVAGSKLDYEAAAGTINLKDADGKVTASVFSVAYTKTGVTNLASRPLTFAFNGGPGSSAVWLHLGCLGPRRIALGDTDAHPAPPYRLVDNEATLLDQSDLVFIDPVSTGYSRGASRDEAKKFHGVEADLKSVGEFIRLYVSRNHRWESPKFLAGESYGTTRASALAEHLQNELGMNCNGIILIAPALNFQTILFGNGNELPYIVYLPGYTATACYHKKLAADLQNDFGKTLDEARTFALGEYAHALLRGSTLAETERQQIASRFARLTGLTSDFVLRKNLRVDLGEFLQELLRKERKVIGRFDSRFTMPAGDGAPQLFTDPSYAAVMGPFTAAVNAYLSSELKYDEDRRYEVLNLRVQPWDWGQAQNSFLDVSDRLRRAMTADADLRVFVATGYYDLATPILSTEYTMSHLHLDPSLRSHVSINYYEGGHMMYTHPTSRQRLKQDLARFLQAAQRASK